MILKMEAKRGFETAGIVYRSITPQNNEQLPALKEEVLVYCL